ncbi:3-isopropylmalate dehydratase small subunit [Pseudalkalibacillus sp. R45]|uniref:3-isopropylmalate dehydratase small subunit n=1 Tax=Pseudalkalibacillus sp. R45 TaxID=3457433 RepID=UPI003FCD99A9
MNLKGYAHTYGDHIDTDRIIPGKYTKTLDLSQLADHVLEDLDPSFREKVREGDIIVAGENFGCGSSREQAPLALKAAGVSAVVARSFARIFFRNAINVGLPVIEVPDHNIETGTLLTINLSKGTVINENQRNELQGTSMPMVMIRILESGGLVSYLKKHGDYIL